MSDPLKIRRQECRSYGEKMVSDFALGKSGYSELSQVVVDALQRMAGYVPDVVGAELPETIEEALERFCPDGEWDDGRKPEISKQLVANWLRVNTEFNAEAVGWSFYKRLVDRLKQDDMYFVPAIDSIKRHEDRPRIDGVIQLPTMPIVELDSALLRVLDWVKGRAWVAGSAVVASLLDKNTFIPNDVDVFCHTDADYFELRETFVGKGLSFVLDENERSVLVEATKLNGKRIDATAINLVRPCGEDWNEPYNVLAGFDLTCSAALAKNPREAYVWDVDAIEKRTIDLITLKYPMKTIGRIFKYWGRGFTPSVRLWGKLADDEQGQALLRMVAPLADVFEVEGDGSVLSNLALQCGYHEVEMSSVDDEYYEEHYEYEW